MPRRSDDYQPPRRTMLNGHRVAPEPGWRPIETRRYPPWWWPFEIMGRWQARAARHLSEELRRGLERDPGQAP